MKPLVLLLALLAVAVPLHSESLTVDWFSIDAGGGASTDGTLSLTGTAGQPDAGSLSDGTLTVQGGFWSAHQDAAAIATPTSRFKLYYSTLDYPNDFIGSVNDDGSENTVIIAGQWPRPSPDGRKLLYHPRGHPENFARNEMAVLDLHTGTSTTLFYHADYLVYYDWTRDGRHVVFDYTCSILKIASDRTPGESTLINSDCYDDAPSLSPVDESIAFHNAFAGLILASPDGTGRHHIPNTSPGDYWPTWTADGTWIIFPGTDGVYKIHPDGTGRTNLWSFIPGTAQAVVGGTAMYGPARISPDGRWVVAAFNLNGTNGIYAIAADGSGALKTIRTVAPPAQIYNFVGGVEEIAPPPAPVLTLTPGGPGKATLSWTPQTPGYVLQEATSLDPSAWVNSTSGATEPIEIPTLVAPKFYRLIRR